MALWFGFSAAQITIADLVICTATPDGVQTADAHPWRGFADETCWEESGTMASLHQWFVWSRNVSNLLPQLERYAPIPSFRSTLYRWASWDLSKRRHDRERTCKGFASRRVTAHLDHPKRPTESFNTSPRILLACHACIDEARPACII